MGLFSRKKRPKDESADASGPRGEGTPADAHARENVDSPDGDSPDLPSAASAGTQAPSVNISFSAFRGVGQGAGPEVPDPAAQPAPQKTGLQAPVHEGTAAERSIETQPPRPALPQAPPTPPLQVETVPGVRDNALVREAVEALPDQPTGSDVLGVLRQIMQGHLFLRVLGNAREQLDAGEPISFGVVTIEDRRFMLAFSSGRALQDSVKADGDQSTSAVAQPVQSLLRHLLEQDFAGLIIDNNSAPKRVVLPRQIIEQAVEQSDADLRLKSLLALPRTADTQKDVGRLLAQSPPMWLAVAPAVEGDESPDGAQRRIGIAEARLSDGTRLVQVHSHPLEIAALGRSERALPITAERLATLLTEEPGLGGVIIDPAGPLITLTRDELAPVLALASRSS